MNTNLKKDLDLNWAEIYTSQVRKSLNWDDKTLFLVNSIIWNHEIDRKLTIEEIKDIKEIMETVQMWIVINIVV